MVFLGFMTFCPEWLTANVNLDTSNFICRIPLKALCCNPGGSLSLCLLPTAHSS